MHSARRSSLLFLTLGSVVLIGALAVPSALACENEIEWESIPLIGVVDVRYKECAETQVGFPTPLIRQTLRLRIESGLPNETYMVVIEGRPVANLRTDANGEAERILERHGLRIGPDGRPVTQKRVDDGDLCEVFVNSSRHEAFFVRL